MGQFRRLAGRRSRISPLAGVARVRGDGTECGRVRCRCLHGGGVPCGRCCVVRHHSRTEQQAVLTVTAGRPDRAGPDPEGHAPAGWLDDELRLVRVRGCGGREAAQWCGLADPGKPHGQPAGSWAQTIPSQGRTSSGGRVFCSTTERPGTHAVSSALDRLVARVNAVGNRTSQAGTSA
ncbi:MULTISPECIES: RNaseH domain-containing protein [unclassified Streptomyces]|uniref:RNaseH domain-containing protein n=1 Tax=unclassified Streptomyces TaxID=2593676 RepID=UPI001F540819|nr:MULTISPECIES: RNaseH domain-containing protein [unclassified Streptomyces]